jgi:hypothetical protein
MSVEPKVTGVGLQFHAAPEELVDLACAWRDAHGMHLAAEEFFPDLSAWSLQEGEMPTRSLRAIDRLTLRSRPIDLSATTGWTFQQANPGSLYVTVGRLAGGELAESAIGGYFADPDEVNLWRRLIRKFRSDAHSGATVHNSSTRGHLPSHRHTTGAHRLAETGVRIVKFKGGNVYTFDDIPG